MLALLAALALAAPPDVYNDDRDHRTLLPQKLINRNLSTQLDSFRLGADLGIFSAAADLQIGTQAPIDGGSPTPFHGFFFTDMFLAVQVFEGIEVNLNVLLLNTTASGGFRILADVLPGLAAHLFLDIATIDGDPLRFDFVTPDLDLVTLGEGLLLETTPLEGFMGGLSWRGFELQTIFGGRVFWQQDDLLHFNLTALDGHVGVSYTQWWTGFADTGEPSVEPNANGRYLAAFGRWSPLPGITLAAEYNARLGGERAASQAALLRGDLLKRYKDFSVHLGYQVRYYQTGFGPLETLTAPSTIPSTPGREDYYATNSFEYLWASPFYDQLSHTAMLEGRYRVGLVEFFGELEWWLRYVYDQQPGPPRVVSGLNQELLPGLATQMYYRVGARLYPFEQLPHRIVAFASNKSIFSFGRVTQPVPFRFIDRPILFIEAEVKL